MPSGVYPEDHKHEKARGLSRNKYDAKGNPRPDRKSRSKLKDVKETLALPMKLNPLEGLAYRRNVIQFAVNHYDLPEEVEEHLKYLVYQGDDDADEVAEQGGGPEELMSKATGEIVNQFKADYDASLKGEKVSTKAPELDQSKFEEELTGKEEEAVESITLKGGKLRQRAERSDAGKSSAIKGNKHMNSMFALKKKMIETGGRLGAVRGIESESSYSMEQFDPKEADGQRPNGEPTWDQRYRSDPTERIHSLIHGKGVFNTKQPKTYGPHNKEGKKLGSYDIDDNWVSSLGGIIHNNDDTSNSGESNLADSITDDFIHGLLFEGRNHPDRDAIISNLNEGKRFDLGFDALLNPYMIKEEPTPPVLIEKGKAKIAEVIAKAPPQALPSIPARTTFTNPDMDLEINIDYSDSDDDSEDDNGGPAPAPIATPTPAPVAKSIPKMNYAMIDKSKEGYKIFARNQKLMIRTPDGKERGINEYNDLRQAEENAKTIASMPTLDWGGADSTVEEKKVYIGEKDPLTGKVRKRRALGKSKKNIFGFTDAMGDSRWGPIGDIYRDNDEGLRGAKRGGRKWIKIGGIRHLIVYGTSKQDLPTASGALPVASWSKEHVVMADRGMNPAFITIKDEKGKIMGYRPINRGD